MSLMSSYLEFYRISVRFPLLQTRKGKFSIAFYYMDDYR